MQHTRLNRKGTYFLRPCCIYVKLVLMFLQHTSFLRRSVSKDVARGVLFRECLTRDGFSHHRTEDTQHGGPALVDFQVELVFKFVSFEHVGYERASVSGTVVTRVVGSGPNGQFHDTAGKDDL